MPSWLSRRARPCRDPGLRRRHRRAPSEGPRRRDRSRSCRRSRCPRSPGPPRPRGSRSTGGSRPADARLDASPMTRATQRGVSSVTLPCVVFDAPIVSWARAVAVALRRPFLRSALSVLFESLTGTFFVLPVATLNDALRAASVRRPEQGPWAVDAGHLTFTDATPRLATRTVCFAIVTPRNSTGGGGDGSATKAVTVAVALRPVESVTVTVPKWVPDVPNARDTVGPAIVTPSSKVQA